MGLSVGVICGLISLFSWGVSDYLARVYSTRVGSIRTAFYVRFINLLPPLLVLPLQAYLGYLHASTDWSVVWMIGPLVGAVLALGYVSYYRGLEIGTVSIVVAVSSAWFAVSVLLAFILLGEVLSTHEAIIICVVAIGIMMLSGLKTSNKGKSTGFAYGLASMFLGGIYIFLYKYLGEAAGPVMASFVGSVASVTLLWIWIHHSGFTVRLPGREGLHIIIAAGILDVCGTLSIIVGLIRAPVFIVAPLAAAQPIVTILLARIFLKERLSVVQFLGMVLCVTGVIVLSASS